MGTENGRASIEGIIEELRALRGALNAKAFGDESPVLVQLTTLKIEVQHLQAGLVELKRMLWGLAAGMFGLIIKMVLEASLLK